MKIIFFLTSNVDKFNEVKAILGDIEILNVDLPEIQEPDSKKIIEAKLQAAFEHHSGPFIVEDTALHLEALNGLPGPFIKWFNKLIGPQKLYEIARDQGSVRAKAVTMIGYAADRSNVHFFEGVIEGELVPYREGEGFGFDFIFKPDGYEQTFSEMGKEEKNKISMRRKALEELKEFLV